VYSQFNKPYKVHKVPTPKDIGPNDVLVKVAVGSLCHTDSMVSSGIFHSDLPVTASHEGSGTVAAVGSSVKKFKVGDRVMCGIPYKPCHQCAECKGPENQRQYCTNFGGLKGVTSHGYFAEYAVIGEEFSAKLPDEVSFETAAPMACAGITIWRAVIAAKLKPGQWLAIVGSGGGLGHLGIQFAKSKGLSVIGVDARPEGLELSKKYGADHVIDARQGDEKVAEQVRKITGADGADVTITLADAKSAAATACAITRMHGTMIQVAQPDNVIIPFRELVFRDVRVVGSLMSSPKEAEEMLAAVAKDKITVTTNRFDGLNKVNELVELAHSGKMAGKGMIIIDQQQIKNQNKAGVELA
jgi:propanol-preferring alcohol dehydrogenase